MRLSIQTPPPRCAVAALPLLAGAVIGFVACCLVGRLVSQQNLVRPFTSFHYWIAPQTLFYPTSHQLQALGRSRLERDKVAVIVGGNSILRGLGQRPREVWTRYLQEELGDGYRVLNLAVDGAQPAEFGGTAAEILARDFSKLIFVTDASAHLVASRAPLSPAARAAGIPPTTYCGYLFWDAYFKGLLPMDGDRRAAIREYLVHCAGNASLQEEVRGARVDGLAYSRDLWTTVAYRHFSTLWRPGILPPFTRPRRSCSDLVTTSQWKTAVRLVVRLPSYLPETLANLRGELALGKVLSDRATRGPGFAHNEALIVPPALRERTLMVVVRSNPHFVRQLTPAEQADYRALQPLLVRELERVGFTAVETGSHYTETDYMDRNHLSEAGGRKLATEVAEAVRRMAHRLGYTKTVLSRRP